MKVLVACEFSGTVREAFRDLGHDAYSCDILPDEIDSPYHYQEDILKHLKKFWHTYDLMIAHPPCTYLANSGVCHLYKKDGQVDKDRWKKMEKAKVFFETLLTAPIPRIAVENPIPHKYGVGKTYSQIIQPWQFGHTERKATCLWLKNLPKLEGTKNVKEEMLKLPKKEQQRLHYLPPSPDRWKIRSTTYKGIARAMAKQWGKFE